MNFVAIDFETADYWPDSACSVALVKVANNEIIDRVHRLIRPPRTRFQFTYIHGITWQQVAQEPCFAELWPELETFLHGTKYFVAHNAMFDRGVLHKCCETSALPIPDLPFRCTVKLARQIWRLPSNRLNLVCEHLGIPLKHHDALSDAEACAKIVIAANEFRGSTHEIYKLKW